MEWNGGSGVLLLFLAAMVRLGTPVAAAAASGTVSPHFHWVRGAVRSPRTLGGGEEPGSRACCCAPRVPLRLRNRGPSGRGYRLLALRGGSMLELAGVITPAASGPIKFEKENMANIPEDLQFLTWPGRMVNSYDLHSIQLPPPVDMPDGTRYVNPGWNKTVVKRGRGQPPKTGELVRIELAVFGKDGDLTKKAFTTKTKNGKHKVYEFYSMLQGNQVVRGLDGAVSTMKPGEIARVCLESFAGHGQFGCPAWDIKPNQPLVMRVRLVHIHDRIENEDIIHDEREKRLRKKRRRQLGIPAPEQKVFKPWYIERKR